MFGYDSLDRRCSCGEREQRGELRRRMLGSNSLRFPKKDDIEPIRLGLAERDAMY